MKCLKCGEPLSQQSAKNIVGQNDEEVKYYTYVCDNEDCEHHDKRFCEDIEGNPILLDFAEIISELKKHNVKFTSVKP